MFLYLAYREFECLEELCIVLVKFMEIAVCFELYSSKLMIGYQLNVVETSEITLSTDLEEME